MQPLEHLTARSLTLVNHEGKPCIRLEGGTDKVGSSIVLMSQSGKTLQIQEQPDGFVTLGIDGPHFACEVSLSSNGLCVRDQKGRLCVTIGEFADDDFRGVTVYKDGQPTFKLPS